MTQVIRFPWNEEEAKLLQMALQNEQVLAFPTETFYGLGGNALSLKVVEQVFAFKQRPLQKALLILADWDWVARLAQPLSPQAQKLAQTFWPGPLTLIFQGSASLPEFLAGPEHTIAIRYSSSPCVQALVKLGGFPLIGTSANRSGFPEADQASAVLSQFGPHLPYLVDGGRTPGERPSTLVNTTTFPFRIERHGAISETELAPYL